MGSRRVASRRSSPCGIAISDVILRSRPKACVSKDGSAIVLSITASKLPLWRLVEHLALLDADVEEILRRKSQRTCQQHRGELLDAGVVFLHRVVEEAARGGDLVLDVGELGLELLEVLAGLEIGISLA